MQIGNWLPHFITLDQLSKSPVPQVSSLSAIHYVAKELNALSGDSDFSDLALAQKVQTLAQQKLELYKTFIIGRVIKFISACINGVVNGRFISAGKLAHEVAQKAIAQIAQKEAAKKEAEERPYKKMENIFRKHFEYKGTEGPVDFASPFVDLFKKLSLANWTTSKSGLFQSVQQAGSSTITADFGFGPVKVFLPQNFRFKISQEGNFLKTLVFPTPIPFSYTAVTSKLVLDFLKSLASHFPVPDLKGTLKGFTMFDDSIEVTYQIAGIDRTSSMTMNEFEALLQDAAIEKEISLKLPKSSVIAKEKPRFSFYGSEMETSFKKYWKDDQLIFISLAWNKLLQDSSFKDWEKRDKDKFTLYLKNVHTLRNSRGLLKIGPELEINIIKEDEGKYSFCFPKNGVSIFLPFGRKVNVIAITPDPDNTVTVKCESNIPFYTKIELNEHQVIAITMISELHL